MTNDVISRHSQRCAAGRAYLETRSAADFILYHGIHCALPSAYLPFLSAWLLLFRIPNPFFKVTHAMLLFILYLYNYYNSITERYNLLHLGMSGVGGEAFTRSQLFTADKAVALFDADGEDGGLEDIFTAGSDEELEYSEESDSDEDSR